MAHIRLISIISAALICTACFAGPYADLQRQLLHASTPDQVIRIVGASKAISNHADIKSDLDAYATGESDKDAVAKDLRNMVDLAASAESRVPSDVDQAQANRIKKSPLYRDQGVDRKRNWLSDAIERLRNIHLNSPKESSNSPGGFPLIGQWVVYAIWALLIGSVLALLFYLVRFLDWRGALTRRAKTLLEEDEPERTLDEWLQLADAHAAAGRYRESVRALYLACLLKFDEHNVARFDRGETNWEHLTRIQASPNRPELIDFTEATQRFDRIWYGFQTRGQPDVDQFRAWYQEISEKLRGVA